MQGFKFVIKCADMFCCTMQLEHT